MPDAPVLLCVPFPAPVGFKNLDESMGVSVKATSSEMPIAKVAVMPKLCQNLPTRPDMNATGRNMTTRENVVAVTARAISFVQLMAAINGVCFSSSICLNMFSRTIMASSITIPVDTESASIVILFRL